MRVGVGIAAADKGVGRDRRSTAELCIAFRQHCTLVERAWLEDAPDFGDAATDAALLGRHTMTGEATSVTPDKGRLLVKTPEGRMLLHFPTSALQNVKKGDSVTVELALKDNGPAAKTQ